MLPALIRIGHLTLGAVPRVVGVVRLPESLSSLAAQRPDFDIVELRVDLLASGGDWLASARRLKQAGVPVILTARAASEGGSWAGSETEREQLLRRCLPDIAAIDVELATPWLPRILTDARAAGVCTIGSFHDFNATPSSEALRAIVERGRRLGVEIIKIAAHAANPDDVSRLSALPAAYPDARICVLGMGPLGPDSRISLPLAGSCLTYGFADAESAPGQRAAPELRRRLAEAHAGYRKAIGSAA